MADALRAHPGPRRLDGRDSGLGEPHGPRRLPAGQTRPLAELSQLGPEPLLTCRVNTGAGSAGKYVWCELGTRT
ncbi:hypothetical protein [Streptomyces sp. NPDC057717]|uniref:hypothetical protein n=1 Tax=unclassified Streptomyces TaxID=2593676 RepID=UPI0036B19B51